MGSTRTMSWAAGATLAIAGSLIAPMAATAAPKPPPPKATNGHKISLVGQITGATDVAFGHGKVFVGAIGDEQTLKGAGVYVMRRGKPVLLSPTPVIGLLYSGGTLYGTSQNRLVAWSNWKNGKFTKMKVIFKRPIKQLPFLEKMAIGPDGRIYVGSSAAGDKGPLATPYSGRIFSMKKDGSDLQTIATGLRQPYAIAFLKGDSVPWIANEGDDVKPFPPDFIVRAVTGSLFGYPGCKWFTTTDAACSGLSTPSIFFPVHATPTGLAARGTKLYIGFFGGTTKAGPEIRTWVPGTGTTMSTTTTQVVRSAVPLVGLAINGAWVYFTDVTGAIYRVKT
jgi:glucose/arabinose dehydrogenase